MKEESFVAEMMLKLHKDGRPFSDMCVLFRASHHSQSLEFELMKRGIPYEYRGGMKFFERSHIKDALAFVRIVANPKDEMAWMRVLLLGKGIGEAAARKAFLAQKAGLDLDAGLLLIRAALGAKARDGYKELEGVLRACLDTPTDAGEMIRAVVKSAYKDILAAEFPNFEERLEDLEQLAVFAAQYKDVDAFLAEVSLYDGVAGSRSVSSEDAETDHAVLSTIHQAKGLEWHTVFVIHLVDQYFPNKRALDEKDGLEEERRLFYVAVTRAARKLFLTYPAVMGEEYLEICQPSLFVDELSPRLYERVELRYTGGKAQKPKAKSGGWDSGRTATVWKTESDMDAENSGAGGFAEEDVLEVDELGERKK
jgi:DNA helicase-2/ATP-dependent DNA helicase PcrA